MKVYVQGSPRKLWIPAGSRIPQYTNFRGVLGQTGQDITEQPSFSRYDLEFTTTQINPDTSAPNIPLTLKCATNDYYNEATITAGTSGALAFVHYPAGRIITLTEDLILYEE